MPVRYDHQKGILGRPAVCLTLVGMCSLVATPVHASAGRHRAHPGSNLSKGQPAPRPGELFMMCGAALRAPVEALRKEFQRRHRIPVRITYAGSACLLAQIAITDRTRPCDLYLPGEEFYAVQAQRRGLVQEARPICYFIPVIMVRRGNPKGIRSLQDLARPGIRVGIGEAKACAIGKTTLELLKKNGLTEAVRKNVVMHASTAPELGNALKLGSLDAAINWDAMAAWYEDAADVVTIPPERNVIVRAPLGVIRNSRDKRAARLFYAFAAGPEGKAIFRRERYTVDLKEPLYPHRPAR